MITNDTKKRMIKGSTIIKKYRLDDDYELFQLVMNGILHPYEAGTERQIHSPEYEALYSELKSFQEKYAEYEKNNWYDGWNAFSDGFYGDGTSIPPSPRYRKPGMERRISELNEIVRRVENGEAPEYLLCNYEVKDGEETKILKAQFLECVFHENEIIETIIIPLMFKEGEIFYEVVMDAKKKNELPKKDLQNLAEKHFDDAKCSYLALSVMRQIACKTFSKSNRREYFLTELTKGSLQLKFGFHATGEEIKHLKSP